MSIGKINIFESNWVDMVFKGRNHAYGAYELRKKSDDYTIRGVILAIVFFTLTISAPVIVNYIKGLVPKDLEDVKIVEVNTLEEPPPVDKSQPPPPPAEPPPPLKSTVKFIPPEIKPDEEVPDEPPPTQEEMKEKDAGVKTEEGDAEGIDASLMEDDGLTGDAGPEIMTFAEQMPEFNGDLYKYLGDNIKYPTVARENGIEGQVVMQFVVGKDGKIDEKSIVIVKKVGWGLEEEAIRVVKSMPHWKPGKQNGNPVYVKCTLPIRFKLDN
ncbi:MAG: TonB family protein [Bacteroidia bacterium]|jgi:protein TonB